MRTTTRERVQVGRQFQPAAEYERADQPDHGQRGDRDMDKVEGVDVDAAVLLPRGH